MSRKPRKPTEPLPVAEADISIVCQEGDRVSHEVESMIYTGETPWHGIGKSVEPWLPVNEAIEAAGVDWTVDLEPVYASTASPGSEYPSSFEAINGYMRTVRSTDRNTLGIVKSKYMPIQNIDTFNWFNEFIEERLAYIEAAGSLRGGRIVWLLARINRDAVSPIDGDELRPYILLSNSHDGTKAARVGFTEVRVVCMNTMIAAHSGDDSELVRILHKGDAKERLEAARTAFDTVYLDMVDRAQVYAGLAATKITMGKLDEYISAVFNIKPRNERKRGGGVLDDVRANFFVELDRSGMNWWSAFNAVTAYLSHDAARNADNRYSSLWFGVNAKKLTSALAVAVAMAK